MIDQDQYCQFCLSTLSIASLLSLLLLIAPLSLFSQDSNPPSSDATVTGELATDDPPVNFRVTGFSDTSAVVAWEVPRNRGITNYVLEIYEHNGTEFVWSDEISDTASGGSGWAWSFIKLTPDTQYKYVLYLRDDQNTTVIEKTVTVRTLTTGGSSTVSNDATLSGLTLSDIDFGSFGSSSTYYTVTVGNSVTETTVTASTNHSGASYEVQLGSAVDDDAVIPLAVGSNRIGVKVTAEDGVTTKIYTVIVTRALSNFSQDSSPSSSDFNGDGTVNLADYDLFVDQWGTRAGDPNWDAKFDLDSDGVIGLGDYEIFVSNWG